MGNWNNDSFCQGEYFDTILVDYLIGAMDYYAPYFQYDILDRLQRHLIPGGRIYVVGMQPIADRGTDEYNNILSRMKQYRDATIMLAGTFTFTLRYVIIECMYERFDENPFLAY